jgi:hypothetical protein
MLFVALADATAFTEDEVNAKPARGAVGTAWVRARQWHDVWLLGVGEVPAP